MISQVQSTITGKKAALGQILLSPRSSRMLSTEPPCSPIVLFCACGFHFFRFIYVFEHFVCMHVCAPCVCWQRSEKGTESPGTEFRNG